ncbi:MAG TPA: GNAT family N-acetyltransferase, partial [Burkholderiales bacterium]|nr:GNAT family N-acetyltransferase [Burkholderiales bacterium]
AASVDVRVEVLQRPDERTLDAVFALFWQTYEKATTKFEKLNRRFFELIAEQPQAHFVLLRERSTGDLVAFMLCFDVGAKVINKFLGIDYTRPKEWLLYFRLWDAAVDWALARGAAVIQSGQTGYAPKIETGHRLVPLTNYCAHRNRAIHALGRLAARRIDWATLDDDLARFVRAHPEV